MTRDKFKISCAQVLTGALQHDFDRVLVIGRYPDGKLYVSGSADTEALTQDVKDARVALKSGDVDVLTGEVAPKAAA